MVKNKHLLASLLVATILIVGTVSMYQTPGMGKAFAASSSTKITFSDEFTPTGPGCENAEVIVLSGSLNMVSNDANGKQILQFHPQGISGVGQTTGTTYRGTGGTIIMGLQDPGESHTYVNNFNIIATEPSGISSIEHLVLHITVNAQGEITADVNPTEHNSCR
jgi:hypothetical protein